MRRQKKSAKEPCAGATHIRSFWLEVFWDLTVCQCVTLDCDYKTTAKDIATQPANRTYLKDIKIVSTFYRLMFCVKSFFIAQKRGFWIVLSNLAYLFCLCNLHFGHERELALVYWPNIAHLKYMFQFIVRQCISVLQCFGHLIRIFPRAKILWCSVCILNFTPFIFSAFGQLSVHAIQLCGGRGGSS